MEYDIDPRLKSGELFCTGCRKPTPAKELTIFSRDPTEHEGTFGLDDTTPITTEVLCLECVGKRGRKGRNQ